MSELINFTSIEEKLVAKSERQKILERNGCVFNGQELLTNHEIALNKDCYCNRPNDKNYGSPKLDRVE